MEGTSNFDWVTVSQGKYPDEYGAGNPSPQHVLTENSASTQVEQSSSDALRQPE
jgi:hypothetical protein